MISVFADTAFFSALLNRRDDLHPSAKRLSESLVGVRIVTTDLVLVEFLNGFCGMGSQSRARAAGSVVALRTNPAAIVEPLTSESFNDAIKLYVDRPDKAWSLTDCLSFIIMERHGINSALTHDRHFEQAGFKALLR